MVTTNGYKVEAGCYIDGHHGQYAGDRLADLAENFGMKLTDDNDPRYWRRVYEETGGDCLDSVVDSMDEIEAWLDENTSDGYYWTWMDGELFLTASDDTANDDNGGSDS